MRLKDIIAKKTDPVITIGQDATVMDAVRTLVQHNIGSLVVVDAEGRVLGIITERDVLREVDLNYDELPTKKIKDAMTKKLIVGVPDDDIEYTMAVMTNNRIRHMPVIEGGKLCGIVSIGDIVKAQLHHVTYENRYLKDYIVAR